MRLIDVDDAIERLRKAEAKMHAINGVKAVDIGTVISFMQNQFVVDAVPVVRCKDCEYHRPINRKDTYENLFVDGCVWCLEHDDGMRADDFCSYGERREHERNE